MHIFDQIFLQECSINKNQNNNHRFNWHYISIFLWLWNVALAIEHQWISACISVVPDQNIESKICAFKSSERIWLLWTFWCQLPEIYFMSFWLAWSRCGYHFHSIAGLCHCILELAWLLLCISYSSVAFITWKTCPNDHCKNCCQQLLCCCAMVF